jgi:hypothetical protein
MDSSTYNTGGTLTSHPCSVIPPQIFAGVGEWMAYAGPALQAYCALTKLPVSHTSGICVNGISSM